MKADRSPNFLDIKRWMTRHLPSLVVFATVAALYLSGGLVSVENQMTEWRFGLTDRNASGDLVLVEIDPKSLREIDVWPWPRGLYGVALEKLLSAGSRRVAFNIDFSTPSSPTEDRMLKRALSQSNGQVILPMFKQFTQGADGERRLTLSLPIAEFREHAQLAFINVQPETDGIVRRMNARESWDKQTVPSLPFALIGDTDFAFNAFYIDYAIRKSSLPRISFVDVVRGTFDKSMVSGKQVIVGATAVELGNQLAVPVYRAVSGAYVQALAYESLAQGRTLLQAPPAPILAVMFLLALFLGPRFSDWSWRRGFVIVLLTCAPLWPLTLVAQTFTPVLIDVTPFMLLISLCYGVAVVRSIDQQGVRLMLQGVEIRRRDVMMRNVVENSFDGIVVMDDQGTIQSVNPSITKIFDCQADEIVGRHISVLVDGICEDTQGNDLFDVLKVGNKPHEMIGRSRGGHVFPVEATVTQVEDDDRQRLVAFVRDISEQKQAEEDLRKAHDELEGRVLERTNQLHNEVLERGLIAQQLRASEQRFRDIAESSSDWFWEMGPDLKFSYLTDSFYEITGIEPASILGKTRDELSINGVDKWKWADHLADLENHRPFRNFQYAVMRQDGAQVFVNISGKPVFNEVGEFVGYRGTGTNITERLQADAELMQSRKMEALGRVAGGIAHNFNNMLQPILLLTRLNMKKIEPGAQMHQDLQCVEEATLRSKELVQQMLAYSRKSNPVRQPIEAGEVLQKTMSLVQMSLPTSIQLTQTLQCDDCIINADESQIQSMIMNITSNAADAIGMDVGKIDIALLRCDVADDASRTRSKIPPGSYVKLMVQDTGHGMDEETLAHIFDPFYTTKEVGSGTGLGLASVWGIVKSHEGHIIPTSTLGEGTVIEVFLPLVTGRGGQ